MSDCKTAARYDRNHIAVDLGQSRKRRVRSPDQKIATVDQDSTIIESWKLQAKKTYQGSTGYQPMLALWAEMDLVLADEFRDGNVPAIQEPLRVAQRAFATLPPTVNEYYFRGDAACYEQELLTWLRDEQRESGPRGRIGFAVSVPMQAALRKEIEATAEDRWQPYGEDSGATVSNRPPHNLRLYLGLSRRLLDNHWRVGEHRENPEHPLLTVMTNYLLPLCSVRSPASATPLPEASPTAKATLPPGKFMKS